MTTSDGVSKDISLSDRVTQFDALLNRIAEVAAAVDYFKPHFIPLQPSKKEPVKGKKFTTTFLSVAEARSTLSRGYNVGLVAHQGGLCFIDVDLKNGEFPLPPEKVTEMITHFDTFTVRTKSGGIQLYFWNEDFPTQVEARTGVLNPKLKYRSTDCGEIRTETQYVVAPGSYVPLDYDTKGSRPDATGVYTVLHDAPLRKLTLDLFPSWIAPKATSINPVRQGVTVTRQQLWVPNQEIRVTGDIVSTTGESLKVIMEVNPEVAHLLSGPTDDISADGSRSGDDFVLCVHLLKYGFNADQIAAILLAYRPYEKLFKNDNYIGITIENALRRLDNDTATTGRKVFDDVADPVEGAHLVESETLPPELPDRPFVLVRGSPRIGKTHWGVTILAGRGTGIYVSHRHEIIKHALEIFEKVNTTSTAVWVVGKNMACNCSDGTMKCETCHKYPVNDYDTSGRAGVSYSDTEAYAQSALAEHRILTKDKISPHYCPYYVLHMAKKFASYIFTIPYFLKTDDDLRNVDTSRYALTVIDEDPTITNFYPTGYEIATYKNIGRLSIGAENLLSPHIEGVAKKLEKIVMEKSRKSKVDKAILGMIHILREIDDILVTLKDTPNLQTKYLMLAELNSIQIANEWTPSFKKEVEHALAAYEREITIYDTVSILNLFEPLLYVAKKPFIWIGKNPSTLHFIADRVLTHPVQSQQILIIGGTESRLFLKDISNDDPDRCAVIEITRFKYANNYIVARLAGEKVSTQTLLLKKAIRGLTTYNANHAWTVPALILCSTIAEQNALATTHKSLAICSTNDDIQSQRINYATGRLNIFYQNSIISRGLDIPFYDVMFVDSSSFATPYWDAMQAYYRETGDNVKAKECAAIKHSLLTDETTNSVVRHSPITNSREDAAKIVVVKDRDYQHIWDVVRKGMHELVIDTDTAIAAIPRLAETFANKVLPDALPALVNQLQAPDSVPHSARTAEASGIMQRAGRHVVPKDVSEIEQVLARLKGDLQREVASRGSPAIQVSEWYLKTVTTAAPLVAGKRLSEKAVVKFVNTKVKRPLSVKLQRAYLTQLVRDGHLRSEMHPKNNERMYSLGLKSYTETDEVPKTG